ncbi:hypothetical protein SAMD00019534_027130 [Acytostelium subglobosum LB1]|uniref:hypothetical protein n=1 Tax=Acytostelium subglobosum LB1 TaxID=1410327 RepID=UPI0006450280|nr:hypothetical protein SAMD00019534_027130 [Acytostelium subglobosum LB1]GAM19538.1 hypothetical protein SAMD00019534_027130 [Acytostelium subglobosum LB1]|eukprot:XP_012757465.1 hypothetical protein SAMD00019534_027130 [Acytostelium subglobosum LB1]
MSEAEQPQSTSTTTNTSAAAPAPNNDKSATATTPTTSTTSSSSSTSTLSIGCINIINKKANAIRRQLATVTPITVWSALSLKHDNIDHLLDDQLLQAIQSLHPVTLAQVGKRTSDTTTASQQKAIDSTTSLQGSSATISSTLTAHTSDDTLETGKASRKAIAANVDTLVNTLQGLLPLYTAGGNSSANPIYQQGRRRGKGKNRRARYDPSVTYKVGKHFVLANVLVDQLQVLLDYLFVCSLHIEKLRDYWESKNNNPSWYILEKSPLFWLRYWNQELVKRARFEKTLQRLHKASNYTSPFITLNNKLNRIKRKVIRLFNNATGLASGEQQQDDANTSDNNNISDDEDISPNISDTESSPISSDDEGGEKQQVPGSSNARTTTKETEEILHPTKELERHLLLLEKMQKLVATAIGRLTYFLGDMQQFETLAEFAVISSQALILFHDTMVMFFANLDHADATGADSNNETINYHINQLVEMSKLIQQLLSSDDDFDLSTAAPSGKARVDVDVLVQRDIEKYQESLYYMATENSKRMKQFIVFMDKKIKDEQPPNALVRNWARITIGAVVLTLAVKYSYDNFGEFKASVIDYYNAWLRFSKEHIELPLRNIWNVIRYDKKTLNVSDPVSFQTSLESLQRMVVDYSKKNSTLSKDEVQHLVEMVARGDISSVMKPYEANIEAPLRNLVFGDLVQLLLIQVQKEKVDVDKAMLAIDKLLQSNELNFQLMAAIPSVLILGGLFYQINKLIRVDNKSARVLRAQTNILSTLRGMHRQLTLGMNYVLPGYLSPLVIASPATYFKTFYPGLMTTLALGINENGPLASEEELRRQCIPFEQYGTLLLSANKLKQHVQNLKSSTTENQWLLEDLQDLESDSLSNKQKILSIQRMFSTYSFLK